MISDAEILGAPRCTPWFKVARRGLSWRSESGLALLLEILGRDDEAKEAYRRYSALPGPKVSTITELRACAAVPSCAASERNIEALRKAGMPEQ